MPIYTYKCKNCEHEFETRQRMSDDPLKDCPVCEGEVRRVVRSVGVVFKGSGFYVTDNRNGNNAKGNSSKKESSGEKTTSKESSETKGSTKTETKTAKKSEKAASSTS
ncbi:MAG: FmdB family zinc ribbon protein [Chloroflexota bacterium]